MRWLLASTLAVLALPCVAASTEWSRDGSGNGLDLSPVSSPTTMDCGGGDLGLQLYDGVADGRQASPRFRIDGDLVLAARIVTYARSDVPLAVQYAVGESSATNTLFALLLDDGGRIEYNHEYGLGAPFSVTAEAPLLPGSHDLVLERDASGRRVTVEVDGNRVIDARYPAAEAPAGGSATALVVGGWALGDRWNPPRTPTDESVLLCALRIEDGDGLVAVWEFGGAPPQRDAPAGMALAMLGLAVAALARRQW